MQGDLGQIPLQIPRDRQSTFEPVLVPKGQRPLAGLEEKIIALYARGASTRDIQVHLQELYGVEISATLKRLILGLETGRCRAQPLTVFEVITL